MAGTGGKRDGAGRKKGVPNKFNADLKAMILGALNDAGGQEYLARQAVESPGPFLTLIGKVLPLQVTGAGGGAVSIEVITGVPRDRIEVDPSVFTGVPRDMLDE